MNVEKNSYTFIFATIMVLIVAALLATTAISLKPHQETNVALEKKQNISFHSQKKMKKKRQYWKPIQKNILLNIKLKH